MSDATAPVHLTPSTGDPVTAQRWFEVFEGAGLDGVVAKPSGGAYTPDVRSMAKVKHERTADCVVAGYRWHKSGGVVGSLLLGLYADDGRLQHVGVAASFTMARRKELVDELSPYAVTDLSDHPWREWAEAFSEDMTRMPGGQSRWSAGKDLSWEPLRPELVVQVAYDHMQNGRFRHTAQFRRWRDDKRSPDCTFDQLEVVAPQELKEIFPVGR